MENRIAVFLDFENIKRAVDDYFVNERVELKRILDEIQRVAEGRIVVKRAYADWGVFKDYRSDLLDNATEPVQAFALNYKGKNGADIRIAIDVMEAVLRSPEITHVALVSGDSDFSPLVSKLRENDRYVIGLGVKSSSSDLLVSNCDEFIFYEDLIRDTKKTRLLHGLPEKKAEAMAQLIDAIQALMRENKETLWGSMVKQTMIRKNPAFNESYYGYSTFSKLLEEAAKNKVVTLERDEKSGTYIITALSEDSGRAA